MTPLEEWQAKVDARLDALEGKAPRPKAFHRPTPEEVRAYFKKQKAEGYLEFLAFYESNGWKVGKNRMENWKAAAAGWIFRARGGQRELQ